LVSASAGTGKKAGVIERLMWLMRDGTDPARILCLTFTRRVREQWQTG